MEVENNSWSELNIFFCKMKKKMKVTRMCWGRKLLHSFSTASYVNVGFVEFFEVLSFHSSRSLSI